MLEFRYQTNGNWYKGNTHLHSAGSDGRKHIEELALVYKNASYDFLCLTDHWVASSINQRNGTNDLLWFNGIELDGRDDLGSAYHIACLGTFSGMEPEMGLLAALESAQKQNAFIILAILSLWEIRWMILCGMILTPWKFITIRATS